MSELIRDISICSWNAQGIANKLGCKLEDDRVIKVFKQHDIVCLTETHCVEYDINIPGFCSFQINRPKVKKARKGSGGIVVLVKKELRKGVTFIKSKVLPHDVIWVKLSKTFFKGWSENLFLCVAYFSPANSSYTTRTGIDFFANIEQDITNYNSQGQIIFTGDINARSGQKLDYINSDSGDFIPVDNSYDVDALNICRSRFNQDKCITNVYGNSLIDLCISSGLRILNGRTIGDFFGKFTCHEVNGSSVVDYVLVHENFMDSIIYFHVWDLWADLSDHCLISFSIKCNYFRSEVESCIDVTKVPDLIRFKWNQNTNLFFKSAMETLSVKKDLKQLCDKESNLSTDEKVQTLTNILIQTAKMSVGIKNTKYRKIHRKILPKWFDNDCFYLKRKIRFLTKRFLANTFDVKNREELFVAKKQYKKLNKRKKNKFKEDILEKINKLHDNNPQEYWNLIKQLRNDECSSNKSDPADNLNPVEWVQYFQKLLNKKSDKVSDQEIVEEIRLREGRNIFN